MKSLHLLMLCRPVRIAVIAVLALLAGASTAIASVETDASREVAAEVAREVEGDGWRVAAHWQNDGTILKRNNPRDRHYTNAVAFTAEHTLVEPDAIANALPFADDFGAVDRINVGFMIGQQIHTPENLRAAALVLNDRPYAGYLYGGAWIQRVGDATMDHFELNVGLVGPGALGEDTQRWIHSVFDEIDPKGWGNELENEVTAQLYVRKKWRWNIYGDPNVGGFGVQLIPMVGVAFGSVHRHVEAGATLRFGGNLPDDFGPTRIYDHANAPALGHASSAPSPWTVYGFLRVGGRVVQHNIFLDGNNFTDSHSVDADRTVGEWQAGVVLAYRCSDSFNLHFGYSQTFLTEEFTQQDVGDAYGAAVFGMTFRF